MQGKILVLKASEWQEVAPIQTQVPNMLRVSKLAAKPHRHWILTAFTSQCAKREPIAITEKVGK